MDNKYYTPTLEEFHVGFRYEFTINLHHPAEYVWEDMELGDNELTNIQFHIERGEIRVKYLDQDDLEELGWELDQCTGKDGCQYYITRGFDTIASLVVGSRELSYIGEHCILIDAFKRGSFEGSCKNYNEMKKLMQMLNIK